MTNRRTRIYQPVELATDLSIQLDGNASRHLLKVLRMTVGAKLTLFNGTGGEYSATLKAIQQNRAHVWIEAFHDRTVESPLKIHLGQGISRGDKMDYTLQKAVELGVHKITPLVTTRCGVKLTAERWDKKCQHWRSIIIAACEQSGRNDVPVILSPMILQEWCSQLQERSRFVLVPMATKRLKDYSVSASVALLIGPEGGLDAREVTLAKQFNFESLNLGPRILRTETAGVAAITLLQGHYGDLV